MSTDTQTSGMRILISCRVRVIAHKRKLTKLNPEN